jgi:Ca-activated chloride channel family protein
MFDADRTAQPATPLAHTELQVTITDLVAEYVLRHHFRNTGTKPIEAVFSFPVPLDAAFLGMQATLAGETVLAEIQLQHQASRTYGDAIAQGHSAVLLRNPEPGVLCTSLGNLLPGEEGVVELRFATALRVADRRARFTLPLVHRPRYGTWRLEQLETPTHDFAIEHPLTAQVRVQGLLAGAPVSCHTHAARFAVQDGALVLDLANAQLDRDLVLAFDLATDLPPRARVLSDGTGSLGLLSFVLPPAPEAALPMDLCLVLDSSGSMAGDAIQQTRAATLAVVAALRPDDRIQVLRFGSTIQPFFRRPMLATPQVCDALRDLVETIQADLGGTRMGAALEQALAQLGPPETSRARAVILVTDGAVQAHDVAGAQRAANLAGVRLFVVAVGSSAGSEVLSPLADATGATLERAVPSEPIDDGVMRQFRRARQAGPVALQVTWPGRNAKPLPVGNTYAGDAVQVAAVLSARPRGEVRVSAGEGAFALNLTLGARDEQPAMRALCGMQRYLAAPAAARAKLALAYGLLTPETSAVLVKLRADGEKGEALPEIECVPQMVPDAMVACVRSLPAFGITTVVLAEKTNRLPRVRSAGAPKRILSDDYRKTFSGSGSKSYESYERKDPPVENARQVLMALYRTMQAHVLDEFNQPRPLRMIVALLAKDLQNDAEKVLSELGVDLDDTAQSLPLLVALSEIVGAEQLDDGISAAINIDRHESNTRVRSSTPNRRIAPKRLRLAVRRLWGE